MRCLIYMTISCLLLAGCSKSITEEEPKLTPDKATLILPAQNEVCVSGTGSSATESTIVLKWNTAQDAESYEVSIKNLITSVVETKPSTATQLTISLSRGTPYSWFVVSKSKDNITATSDTWKFYNSGPGTTNYAPFPADNLLPKTGQAVPYGTGKIQLSWIGGDTDNDIKNYDVYFGTATTPPLFREKLTAQNLTDVNVTPNTKYYWKVVTRDNQGNTSESELVQFSTTP